MSLQIMYQRNIIALIYTWMRTYAASDDKKSSKYYGSLILVKILVISDLQTKTSSVFEKSVSNDWEASSI